MNWVPQNGAKKTASQRDGVKRVININKVTAKEPNPFYRESKPILPSDSGDSSRNNSVFNNSDYQISAENAEGNNCGLNTSRDEIAERLTRVKIGYNKNAKSDSRTVYDLQSENDPELPSIIAGNLTDNVNSLHSIHSVADSRFSIILAGRLDIKDDLYANRDEHSLLNTAINEADETDDENRSSQESSHFVDSLEISRKETSSCGLNEITTSKVKAYCAVKQSGNLKGRNDLFDNDENIDPNTVESRRLIQPRIISNETVHCPIKIIKNLTPKVSAVAEADQFHKPASKHKNDILQENCDSAERTASRFNSLPTKSEELVVADVKTPCRKGSQFIEECCKSTPRMGVNADTFGSELLSNISNLSALGSENFEQDKKNLVPDYRRDGIVKRISQQFAQEPRKFTERLVHLVEESILGHTKPEDSYSSGVNLSRLTEEFRKICRDYGKRIEDESMPDFRLAPSFNVSTPPIFAAATSTLNDTAATSFQNFTKLGGGTKVYRKTPRRVLQASPVTQCRTPNCINALHKARNNNLYSPGYCNLAGIYDNTETFEFWESLCYEMSPTKYTSPIERTRSKLSVDQIAGVLTQEDLIRKSDQQMFTLSQASPVALKTEKEDGNCSAQKLIEHPAPFLERENGKARDPIQKHNCGEIDQSIALLVEKRRRCFEEARKVFEGEQSNPLSKNSKSGTMVENKPLSELENQARFVNTMLACVDYFEHVKTLQSYRESLQCILECSEDSESPRDNVEDSKSIKFVEAVILPPHNQGKYRIEGPELSPKTTNLIAQTCLYIPGTPKISEEKSFSKSPNGQANLSPQKLSPRARSPSIVSKKIKSPVSTSKKKSLRAAKPASHAFVPRTPSITPEFRASRSKQSVVSCRSGINSTPRCAAHSVKPATNSPSLMDVTNTKKRIEIPKVILTNPSPLRKSQKKSTCLNGFNKKMVPNCQMELEFSDSDTPEVGKQKKRFFYTPGKTPARGNEKPKMKYFQTPKRDALQKKLPGNSPGSCRVNYNTVESPIRSYIRGTNPNLITNVRGKANERLLTPRGITPNSRSKVASPILSRSPCMSPQPTESSRLKFQLTPSRKREGKQEDVLNIALCETDPSSNIGSESTSHSPFPKIFHKPAPSVKMIKDIQTQRRVLIRGAEEKVIYRHEGRLKSAAESKAANISADGSTKGFSCDSGDISLLHQRPVATTNYLPKK